MSTFKKNVLAIAASIGLVAGIAVAVDEASAATTDVAVATATPDTAHVGDVVQLDGIRCTVACTQDWTYLNGSRYGIHIGYGDVYTGRQYLTITSGMLNPLYNNLAQYGVIKVRLVVGEKCVGSPRLGCSSTSDVYIKVAP